MPTNPDICPHCGYFDIACQCNPIDEDQFERIWREHRKRRELEDGVIEWDKALKALMGQRKEEL